LIKSLTGNDLLNHAFGHYADMVVRIAFHNLRNKADAEDVAQEVFLKLLKNAEKLQAEAQGEEHLKAWLIRVTVNRCKDFRKSFWQRNSEPLDESLPALEAERRDLLDEVLKLPYDYRNVIYLHFYEGYTIAEMAQILKKNPNTVGSWLTRAKKKLKTQLTDGGYFDE
jgi:RNA polymerase sigma-70 factor (ECF subfamily)